MSHVLNNVEKYQKLVDALNDFFCDTGVEPHMTAALLEKFGADVLCLAKFIRINGNDPDPRSPTLRAAVLAEPKCPSCAGTGFEDDDMFVIKCFACGGTGILNRSAGG